MLLFFTVNVFFPSMDCVLQCEHSRKQGLLKMPTKYKAVWYTFIDWWNTVILHRKILELTNVLQKHKMPRRFFNNNRLNVDVEIYIRPNLSIFCRLTHGKFMREYRKFIVVYHQTIKFYNYCIYKPVTNNKKYSSQRPKAVFLKHIHKYT